jgi:hypothetical protein
MSGARQQENEALGLVGKSLLRPQRAVALVEMPLARGSRVWLMPVGDVCGTQGAPSLKNRNGLLYQKCIDIPVGGGAALCLLAERSRINDDQGDPHDYCPVHVHHWH